MKSMIKSLVAIVLIQFMGSVSQASSVFIGNGGEGLRKSGVIQLRDFVESGLNSTIYFGIQEKWPNNLAIDPKFIQTFDLDSKLLIRKINDLDFLIPGFSKVILEILSMYTWSLTDETLGLLPDEGQTIDISSYERLQLANRSLLSIRIQKQYWQSLNSENRIGLIFHEIIFSLLKPISFPNGPSGVVFQSSRMAREVVGRLFQESSFRDSESRAETIRMLEGFLNINASDFQNNLRLSVSSGSTSSTTSVVTKVYDGSYRSDLDIARYIQQACLQYHKYVPESFIYITALRAQVQTRVVNFNSPYGAEYGIHVAPSLNVESRRVYPSIPNCQNEVMFEVKKLF